MQSTLAATETDPHDIFVIEPDVVMAARPDHAKARLDRDAFNPEAAPPINTAPDISVVSAVAEIESTLRAAANDDIRVPHDIHSTSDRQSGQSFWGPWAKRASVGFAFALCSAVAAESWNHYGDSAKAVIANWTPAFALPSSQPSATADAAPPAIQAAAADQAPVPAQSAPDTASTAATPAAVLSSDAPALAAMSQEIAQLKATVEQLKAGQEQMAQQIARDAAKPAVIRTSPAKPAQPNTAQAKPSDPNWRAKVTAALPPRPAPPPIHNPRPAYATAPATYYPPQATYGSPPQGAYPPQPAPTPYESRAQVTDPTDGAPVIRPPMPLQ